jgi:hypothetical protein
MLDQLKIACTTLLFFFSFRLHAETDSLGLPNVNGKIKWIIREDVMTKDKTQLFADAQRWLSRSFGPEMYSIEQSDPEEGLLCGELITGTPRWPQRRVTYTIKCEENRYTVELTDIATYIGGTKKLLGVDKGWAYLQYGFDYYMKRKKSGKNVRSYERAYQPLRAHVSERIIAPLKKIMNQNI